MKLHIEGRGTVTSCVCAPVSTIRPRPLLPTSMWMDWSILSWIQSSVPSWKVLVIIRVILANLTIPAAGLSHVMYLRYLSISTRTPSSSMTRPPDIVTGTAATTMGSSPRAIGEAACILPCRSRALREGAPCLDRALSLAH